VILVFVRAGFVTDTGTRKNNVDAQCRDADGRQSWGKEGKHAMAEAERKVEVGRAVLVVW
jgi:hypothetical protein